MTFRLGLSGGIVPTDPAAMDVTFARTARALGATVLATHLAPPPDALIATGQAARIRALLADHGIAIVQATGSRPALVTDDPARLAADLERLARAGEAAAALGSPWVLTGCGSLHPEHPYGPHPGNHAPATRDRLVAALRAAAPRAADAGVGIALEAHVATTLDTPESIAAILGEVDHPAVRLNFDPVNLLGTLDAAFANGAEIARMAALLGPFYAPTAHLKDVVIHPELVVRIAEGEPGEGILDLDAFYAAARGLGPEVAVIVEHLPAERVPAAIARVRAAAADRGIHFAAPGGAHG